MKRIDQHAFLDTWRIICNKKKDNNSLIHQKTLENNELEIYVLSERIK